MRYVLLFSIAFFSFLSLKGQKTYELPEVSVFNKGKVDTVFGTWKYSVADYEFIDDKILILTFKKSLEKPSLRLIDMNQKVLSSFDLPDVAQKFYKDYMGYVNVLCANHIYRVIIKNDVFDGEIYNGADDDGSGTVSLLEIAQAFQEAKNDGHGPKRSILFLHVTGEEHGLYGSSYYTENPLFPLANTISDVNIDMIGRRDEFHLKSNNYIYLIGSNFLSTDLYNVCQDVNKKYINIKLDYKYNSRKDPNRFYYRSDHYNFAKHNIPSVFLFNGVHDDYHQASDEIDKIEFDALQKRTQLAFVIAWELANRKNRPVVDKSEK